MSDYSDAVQPVLGVFIYPGQSVHIVDDIGEICCQNYDEISHDNQAFTASLFAVALATAKGAQAVRKNLEDSGITIDNLCIETFHKLNKNN